MTSTLQGFYLVRSLLLESSPPVLLCGSGFVCFVRAVAVASSTRSEGRAMP